MEVLTRMFGVDDVDVRGRDLLSRGQFSDDTLCQCQPMMMGRPAQLSASGRLPRKQRDMLEKTDDERRLEAEERGFDSWDENVSLCEDADPTEFLNHRTTHVDGP